MLKEKKINYILKILNHVKGSWEGANKIINKLESGKLEDVNLDKIIEILSRIMKETTNEQKVRNMGNSINMIKKIQEEELIENQGKKEHLLNLEKELDNIF